MLRPRNIPDGFARRAAPTRGFSGAIRHPDRIGSSRPEPVGPKPRRMAIYQLGDRVPQIDPSAFVHESAVVIGAVTLGKGVSVWAHATLRGDNEPIVVGDETNIQECCVLHTDPG